MEFSLQESLVRPTKDNKYFEKMIIGGGFYLLALCLYVTNFFANCMNSPSGHAHNIKEAFIQGQSCTYNTSFGITLNVVSFLLLAIPLGYIAYYVHNYIHGKDEILPTWKNNIFSFFKKGLMLYFVIAYYYIIILVFVSVVTISFMRLSTTLNTDPMLRGFFILMIIAGVAHLIFFSLVSYIIGLYAENFRLTQGLKLFTLIKYVFKAFDKYLICLVFCGFVYSVYMAVNFILNRTIIAAPVMSFLIMPVALSLITPFINVYMIVRQKENIVKDQNTSTTM